MIVKLNVYNLAFALIKLKNQKEIPNLINKRGLNHRIKWHFQNSPKNKISYEDNLSTFLPNKDYWAEEYKEHPL